MNLPSTQERRRLKRRSLAYYMLVLDANTEETLGHLVDISTMGLMMDCQKPLPLEKDFRLRLNIMPEVASKSYIRFTARTKWCLPDAIEPQLYDIGFSIIEIATSDSQVIQSIADKYAAHDSFSFPIR